MERKDKLDGASGASSGTSTSHADNGESATERWSKSCKIFARSSVPLPRYEICFYFLVWGLVAGLMVIYCAILSWEYEWEHRRDFRRSDFIHGWIERQLQDVSEFEWNFWFRIWSPHLVLWAAGHSFISIIVSKLLPRFKLHIWIVYALCAVTYVLGYKSTLILVFHATGAYIATMTGSPAAVWTVILLLLSTLNLTSTTDIFKTLFPGDPHSGHEAYKGFHLLLFSTAMFDMRLASFCLERCRRKDGESGYGFIDMLSYVFYIPFMYTGPILTYEKFRIQVASPPPWTKQAIFDVAKRLIRQCAYIILIEYHLNYFYYTSMSRNFNFLTRLGSGEVAVLLYCKVMFFYLKYLPLFGVPSLFASLDKIQGPKGPACVSRISTFSEIWKTFDRGFHSFITRYIYIPMGGSAMGVSKQLMAVSACFGFIYIWHGTDYNLFVWALVNFVGMLIEISARKISNLESVRMVENRYLSIRMSRRLTSLLCVPPLCMSLLGVIYFFDGEIVGNLFYRKCIVEGSWFFYIVTLVTLYCGCNASFEAWNWDVARGKKLKTA